MKKNKHILFIHPYPKGTAASQRFRFEHYYLSLQEEGFTIKTASFLDDKTWDILYKKGNASKKILGVFKGFLNRIKLLFTLKKYDYIFIHREATPLGFPFVEWWISKILKRKYIFDFDDAIWLPNTTSENKIIAFLKFHNKTKLICKWAFKVSVGNEYLANFAKEYNQNISIQATVVDTNFWHKEIKNQKTQELIIGWTGTHSTLKYLNSLIPILQKLSPKYTFKFLVIADKKPDFKLNNLVFCQWNKTTEIQDLLKMNIGVMPLEDNQWTKGKCGFKAIQYMSLGIPALASPVEINQKIIEHQRNGFLCKTTEDWEKYLELLLKDENLRIEMGKEARKKIVNHYSVSSQTKNFNSLFKI